MSDELELKPCPLCKEDTTFLIGVTTMESDDLSTAEVECERCHFSCRLDEWNALARRPGEDVVRRLKEGDESMMDGDYCFFCDCHSHADDCPLVAVMSLMDAT